MPSIPEFHSSTAPALECVGNSDSAPASYRKVVSHPDRLLCTRVAVECPLLETDRSISWEQTKVRADGISHRPERRFFGEFSG